MNECPHENTITHHTGDGTPIEHCTDCGSNKVMVAEWRRDGEAEIAPQHDSDCSTNNRGVPELRGPCDCSADPQQHAQAAQCPECDGRGFTYWGEGTPGNGFDVAPEPPEQERCQVCGGSGKEPPEGPLVTGNAQAALSEGLPPLPYPQWPNYGQHDQCYSDEQMLAYGRLCIAASQQPAAAPSAPANAGPTPGDMPIDRFVASLPLPVYAPATTQEVVGDERVALARQIVQDTNDTLREQSATILTLKAENDRLRAALASPAVQVTAVPEGWQLVPKIATNKMICCEREEYWPLQDQWNALLAAAPSPALPASGADAAPVQAKPERVLVDGVETNASKDAQFLWQQKQRIAAQGDAPSQQAEPFAYFARKKGLCSEWGEWFEVGKEAYAIRIALPRDDVEVAAAIRALAAKPSEAK